MSFSCKQSAGMLVLRRAAPATRQSYNPRGTQSHKLATKATRTRTHTHTHTCTHTHTHTQTHTIRFNLPYTATLIPRQDDEAVLPPMSPMCSVFYAIAPAGARHRRDHAHDGIPVVGKRGHVDMGIAL